MAHEFIQVSGMKKGDCDGLFLHPVVGMKKANDYTSSIIIKSYEIMQKEYYEENKTAFGVFQHTLGMLAPAKQFLLLFVGKTMAAVTL